MQLAGKESWSVSFDLPEVLEFASYIGQQEGYNPEQSAVPASTAEAEWREWWLQVPELNMQFMTSWQELIKANPPDYSKMQGLVPPFDSPDFNSFSTRPALKALLHKHWDSFLKIRSRNGAKPTIAQFSEKVRKIQVQKFVQELEGVNKRQANPFKLKIYFVPWPENYERIAAPDLMVLSTSYLNRGREKDFEGLLRAQISKLGFEGKGV
ncbi:MAG TPA: hypothetical protein VH186_12420 [Chloroflexia bacterium]|nr:hypothetical protein [Chloroflexia bacterium]